MSRPLRIEFPGALYHVTSRGDRREPIFEDDVDRQALLDTLAHALSRFDARALAYCLMGNHYHFVLHTRQANLSVLMREINGVYTQRFNRRHGKVGHLFQGRFKAILVDKDSYLAQLCPYVELNPVRAGMVAEPADWPWSSYRAHTGQATSPDWLDTAGLHGHLLQRPPETAEDHAEATQRYVRLVADARKLDESRDFWGQALRQQIYLGDVDFVERMQALAKPSNAKSADTPKAQRSLSKPLSHWLQSHPSREQALHAAHTQGGLTMTAMARELGLSVSRVSRLIGAWEATDHPVQAPCASI